MNENIGKIRRFSDLYYPNYVYREGIKSKTEMSKMTMGICATLNYYLEQEILSNGDIEVMERRIAEYELIVGEILKQSEDNNDYNFVERQRLIDNIISYYDKLEEIYKVERTEKSNIGFNF